MINYGGIAKYKTSLLIIPGIEIDKLCDIKN